MGLYSNPLAYTGYHPQVTGTPFVTNSTVRAATQDEVDEGSLDFCYVSPSTLNSAITNLSTLSCTGDFNLGTTQDATVCTILNFPCTEATNLYMMNERNDSFMSLHLMSSGLPSTGFSNLYMGEDISVRYITLGYTGTGQSINGPRQIFLGGGPAAFDDTMRVMFGAYSANTQSFNLFTAAHTGGTQRINMFSGSSTSTQEFNLFTGTGIGFTSIGTGNAAHETAIGGTNAGNKIGFFGVTPITKPIGTTDLRSALINLGLYSFGGATPLNLNGGNFTAEQVVVSAPTVSGASPIVNNTQAGQASFSDVITAGNFGTLTITNSSFTSSAVILAVASCATASSAVTITRINPSFGTCSFTVFNAGSASTATSDIIINFQRLN